MIVFLPLCTAVQANEVNATLAAIVLEVAITKLSLHACEEILVPTALRLDDYTEARICPWLCSRNDSIHVDICKLPCATASASSNLRLPIDDDAPMLDFFVQMLGDIVGQVLLILGPVFALIGVPK